MSDPLHSSLSMERFQFDVHRAVSALLHSAVLVSRDAAAFCSARLCRSLTVVALQPTVKTRTRACTSLRSQDGRCFHQLGRADRPAGRGTAARHPRQAKGPSFVSEVDGLGSRSRSYRAGTPNAGAPGAATQVSISSSSRFFSCRAGIWGLPPMYAQSSVCL